MYIFSKKEKKKIIGIIFRGKKISQNRKNLSPVKQFLQVSVQKLSKGFEVKSHIHIKRKKNSLITQEVWLILKGEVEIKIYDLDAKIIKRTILKSGDMYILFNGGHDMKVLKKNTFFYEIKNGPYNKKVKDIKYFN